MDESGTQSWVCEQEGELVAYLNPDAFVKLRHGLWFFANDLFPPDYGDELSIWTEDDPPARITGKRFGICQLKLVRDSHTQTAAYKNGGKVVMGEGRFDLYVTRDDFKRAFMGVKTIGRRRRGKTVNRVKLFDVLWIERIANERWPEKEPARTQTSDDPNTS